MRQPGVREGLRGARSCPIATAPTHLLRGPRVGHVLVLLAPGLARRRRSQRLETLGERLNLVDVDAVLLLCLAWRGATGKQGAESGGCPQKAGQRACGWRSRRTFPVVAGDVGEQALHALLA